jgi:hypothetical protein
MNYFYILPILGIALGYAYFFYRRSQVKKAGGGDAYARNRLNRLFQLTGPETVTAVWGAVTIPKKSSGQKVTEAASAVFAAVGGVGVKYVGRDLVIACTTENRVLILDKEDEVIQAYGPGRRPSFVDTGKEGTKQTSQTQWGWVAGAIVSLEIPGQEPIEIDILATAVPILAGWSRGADVSRLPGPIPHPDTV